MDAYRLAGDDDLAVEHAREVLRKGAAPDGSERSPMRTLGRAESVLAYLPCQHGLIAFAGHYDE
jgi:hypothetical protein